MSLAHEIKEVEEAMEECQSDVELEDDEEINDAIIS